LGAVAGVNLSHLFSYNIMRNIILYDDIYFYIMLANEFKYEFKYENYDIISHISGIFSRNARPVAAHGVFCADY